jgi:uncharacterized iron-regulated membrane protein
MTVGVLLVAYWVVSGLTLAVFDATDPQQAWAALGGGPGARLSGSLAGAQPVPDPGTLGAGIRAALATAGTLPIAGVDYRMTGAIPRLQLSEASGERDTELRFYATTGQPMTPQVADGDPFGPRPREFELRERIKSLHKGDAYGVPGQALGLLTGLLVITLAISGALLYLQLWRARRPAGHTSLFWISRESVWRRLHRGIALVAMIFVLNKAVTGTILAWGEIQVQLAIHHVLPFPYPMPTPMPPYSEGLLSADALQGLQTSFNAARAVAPDAPIVAIELVRRGGHAKGLVTLGGAATQTLAFDMATGVPLEDWATSGMQAGNGYFTDWHQRVKRMHRGDIIGRFAGRYADIAVGAALLYLLTSGVVMYAQLLGRRRRAGQTGLFWK